MGKRKQRKDIQQTLISGEENGEDERSIIDQQDEGGEEEEEEEDKEGSRFFACYLLTSLCPRFKGHTYIGYTVNPRRRIRQHNGEIRSGAWRTKKKRPWEMVFCIYGFPTNVAALQFEWAWQHPVQSLAVRRVATTFKSLSGMANKIKLAYTMLTLPAWNSLKLTVNFFSTKYKMYTAGCPNLPVQMRIQVCSMDELPCYTGSNQNSSENEEWDRDKEFSMRGKNQESLMGVATNHRSPSDQESSMGAASNQQFPCDQGTIPEKRRKQINQIEGTCYERSSENIWTGQQRNFPNGTSSSSVTTSSYNIVSDIEDGHMSRLIEEVTTESVDHPVEKLSTTASVADKDSILMKSPRVNYEVEVIDVFTPSPRYRASSGRKKRLPNGTSSSSVTTSSYNIVSDIEDGHMSRLIEEVTTELVDHPVEKQSTTASVADKDSILMKSPRVNYEVEVIDVFTPSPCYKKSSGRKKRLPNVYPEIIDLTVSPICL